MGTINLILVPMGTKVPKWGPTWEQWVWQKTRLFPDFHLCNLPLGTSVRGCRKGRSTCWTAGGLNLTTCLINCAQTEATVTAEMLRTGLLFSISFLTCLMLDQLQFYITRNWPTRDMYWWTLDKEWSFISFGLHFTNNQLPTYNCFFVKCYRCWTN